MQVEFKKIVYRYLSQPKMVWVEQESRQFMCEVTQPPKETDLIICAKGGQGMDAGDYPVQVEDLEAGRYPVDELENAFVIKTGISTDYQDRKERSHLFDTLCSRFDGVWFKLSPQ